MDSYLGSALFCLRLQKLQIPLLSGHGLAQFSILLLKKMYLLLDDPLQAVCEAMRY